MTERIQTGGLRVARVLHDFINDEALPGTELAGMTWLGTCRNPDDGLDYIISYNDCCGIGGCGRCMCKRNEGDLPMWMPPKNNDSNWCQGVTSRSYHCTISAVVGVTVKET